MRDEQNAQFQMDAAVMQVLNANPTVWSGTPSFAIPAGLLQTDVLDKIPAAAGQQQTSTKGVTLTKKAARGALENHLWSMAGAIEAAGIATTNQTLRQDAHLPQSSISHASEDEILGMESRISKLATSNISILGPFGVSAARIAALDTDADTFAGMIGKPRATRAIAVDGTTQIENLVTLSRTYLDAMDGQMILFKDRNPDFYNEYFTARKLVDPPSRPRAIYITVRDTTGAPVPGAVVSIKELNVKRVTSANGNCFVPTAPDGSYDVACERAGYTTNPQTADVAPGTTAHVDFVMTTA